jgi:tape measure domain-containing protein
MSQTTELLLRIKQQGGEQLTRLSGSFKNLGQQAAAANVNFKEVSDELRKIQQTSANSINNLKGYANAWREIANSVEIGTAEFKQANAEAAKLEAQLRKVQPGGRGRLAAGAQIAGTIAGAGVFGGLEGAAGAGIGAIVGGVPGAITGGAIGAQVGMFRQGLGDVATYAAELSKQRQALRLVTKDSFEYQRALSFINQTSRDLAIPQEIITRQFTQLTASVKGAGGNVRDAEKAFIGVASGIRGTGGSLEQLDSALTATSQVFSKGKVSAEELRQQIGERLPGAFSLFAKALDMTPQELDKALEKGQVSLQDFQLFAEKLFLEYGESAKILADGPDAAGDRLKTQLAELKGAIGPILKDMGASFQNFASEAIKSFLSLGKELERFGRLMEEKFGGKLLDNAIRNVKAQDAIIKQLEAEQLVRVDGLSKEEKSRLSLARALRAGSMQIIQGAKAGPEAPVPEKPSNLPGIDTTGGGDSKSILNKLQSDFSRSIAVLGRQFNNEARKQLLNDVLITEQKITAALKKGNLDEAERLRIIQRRKALEITRDVLINEESALEERISQGKAKGLDITNAQIRLDAIRLEREQAVADIRKLDNDELAKTVSFLNQIKEKLPTYKGGEVEQITVFGRMKEEIDALKQSFEDIQPRLTDLAGNLSTSLGTAFSNLVFSAQSAREALGTLFQDIAKSFQNMVIQMINDYLKLQIMTFFRNLFAPAPVSVAGNYFGGGAPSMFTNPSFGVGTGSFGGSLLPSFAMGGIMTANGPLKLKRYAAGGIATGPQLAMYGEGSRPEAYVPLPDGRSIPVTMKGGGVGNVVVNVDANGSNVEGNGQQANALGKAIGIAVQQELIKQKRPGGLLA